MKRPTSVHTEALTQRVEAESIHNPTESQKRLPRDADERIAFCFAYGDAFTGENDAEARRYAQFVVLYCRGMGLGPWAK